MAASVVVCSQCGKSHPIAESELVFHRPDAIWEIPKAQRAKRCKETNDLCVLWGRRPARDRYYVRAVLPLPVAGRDSAYRIGVWIHVAKKAFFRILKLWDVETQNQEPPFRGRLANQLPSIENTIGLIVELRLAGPKERPAAFVTDTQHALFLEQSTGITAHRALEYTPGREGRVEV
jgi:hypothetical protein